MRHGMVGRHLGRSRPHYHSLMNNLITSLLKHESIRTTLPKAKEVRPLAEKLITLGKRGTLHARRLAFRTVRDAEVLRKLFEEIAPRMKARQGGYTRILKLGARLKDAAPMALLELVDFAPKAKTEPERKKAEQPEANGEKLEKAKAAKKDETKK